MVYPAIEASFKGFRTKVDKRAQRLLWFAEEATVPALYRHGMNTLISLHSENKLCLGIADKGYGFVLMQPSMVQKQLEDLLAAEKFLTVHWQELLKQTVEVAGYVSWRLGKAHADRMISRKNI